jgi:hypothetical protein
MKFFKSEYKKLLKSTTILKDFFFFKTGDKIFLSVKNIRMRKFYKILTNRYLGPFKISEKIDNNVYNLELLN